MQLGSCIYVLKLPGRLLNHSEAIKLTQGSLIATEMALNWKIRAQENTKYWGRAPIDWTEAELATDGSDWAVNEQGSCARGEGSVTAQAR